MIHLWVDFEKLEVFGVQDYEEMDFFRMHESLVTLETFGSRLRLRQ